ncbi:hypothetical protein V8D89_009419 [Ganoderma adspersum]
MPGQHVNEDSGPRIPDPARVAVTAEAVLVTPAPTTPANFTFRITDDSASDTSGNLRPHYRTLEASSSTHPEDTANDHLDCAIELGNQAIARLRDVLQERLAAKIPEPPVELPAAPSYPVVIPQYYRLLDILQNGLQHHLSEPYDNLSTVTISQTQQHEAALRSLDARYIRIYCWKPQPLYTPAEVIFHTDWIVDEYYATYELVIKFMWYPRYPIINVASLNTRAYESLFLEVRIALNIFVIPVNILDTYHRSTGLLHLFPRFNTPVALPAPPYSA